MTAESSWLADGVREIERVVKAAQIVEPKIFELPREKPGTYAIVTPGPAGMPQEVKKIIAGPLWHNERLETPQELREFVESLKESRNIEAAKGVFYIGPDKLTYHYDFEDRRDRASVTLIESVPCKLLKAGINQTQRDFIRTLRIAFAGCLPADSTFLTRLRKVEHKTAGGSMGVVEKGAEAMHRSVNAQLDNRDELPDEITLSVNLFENFPACRVHINCAIEYDVMTTPPKFELLPYPNELQRGMQTTLDAIRTTLGLTGVPAFIGTAAGGKAD